MKYLESKRVYLQTWYIYISHWFSKRVIQEVIARVSKEGRDSRSAPPPRWEILFFFPIRSFGISICRVWLWLVLMILEVFVCLEIFFFNCSRIRSLRSLWFFESKEGGGGWGGLICLISCAIDAVQFFVCKIWFWCLFGRKLGEIEG